MTKVNVKNKFTNTFQFLLPEFLVFLSKISASSPLELILLSSTTYKCLLFQVVLVGGGDNNG